MPNAFVLLNIATGSEDEVIGQLKKIENVKEAYVSYGVYDIIVKVASDTMENLKSTITQKIRSINKVRSTLTLIMLEDNF